jgi:hypothetical protein
MTGRWRFTILPNTVRLRRVLAGISGWPSWRLVPGVRGYLVIPRLRAVTPCAQSRMRAKSSTLPHCCMRCISQNGTTSAAEITLLHIRRLTSLSLWQTKEGHRVGKRLEPQRGVAFLH